MIRIKSPNRSLVLVMICLFSGRTTPIGQLYPFGADFLALHALFSIHLHMFFGFNIFSWTNFKLISVYSLHVTCDDHVLTEELVSYRCTATSHKSHSRT